MSVYGAYASESTPPGGIEITHGDSKDHRPDLKQFIVEMMCGNDGEVPLAIEIASGNQSDKAVFGQRLKAFAQQWDVDGIRVADSALYSEGNLSELGALRWMDYSGAVNALRSSSPGHRIAARDLGGQ